MPHGLPIEVRIDMGDGKTTLVRGVALRIDHEVTRHQMTIELVHEEVTRS